MEHKSLNLSEYWAVFNRRKRHIVVPWLLVSLLAVIVAYSLPRTYRSTALMLLQTPIPAKPKDSTGFYFSDEQIQTVYQQVLRTENILKIVDKLNLYDGQEREPHKSDLVEDFKENTSIERTTSSLASNANSGMADIVFNVSYTHKDPVKAKQVVNELTELLIKQNDNARVLRADKLTDFLSEEMEKLNLKNQEIDKKIAEYKANNSQSLPDVAQANLSALERTETELSDTENQIRSLKDKMTFLAAELAKIKSVTPYSVKEGEPKNKEEALRMLQAEYAKMSSIYSKSHPSLMRVKREIQALSSSANSSSPGVLLGKSYQAGNISSGDRFSQKSDPDLFDAELRDPAYTSLKIQYQSMQSELQTLLQKQLVLKDKFVRLQSFLAQSPQTEMEFSALKSEQESTTKKFNQLKEKWLDAKFVQAMEQQQKGETLIILEPAFEPTHPEKAIRRKVFFGGSFAGLLLGIGLAFLMEILDTSIRGFRSLEAAIGFIPLIVIPYIESESEEKIRLAKEKRTKRLVTWSVLISTILLIAAFLSLESASAKGKLKLCEAATVNFCQGILK